MQTLPKQLAREHAKDITFLSGESWRNCIELSYSLFCMFHDLAQLTIPEFYCFSLIYRNRYVSVPAEISFSLAPPNIKKHCTSQCFALGFINLIFKRYKKFQKR